MPETIELKIDYQNLFKRFLSDSMLHLNRCASPHQKTFTRREIYGFVASFRVALGAITKEADIVELRDSFTIVAEKMFEQVTKEENV